jgi:hypothetical protein
VKVNIASEYYRSEKQHCLDDPLTNDPKPDSAEYWFAGVFGGLFSLRTSPVEVMLAWP